MAQVRFNEQGSPIKLTVESGPPCLGGFFLLCRDRTTNQVTQLFPQQVSLIHDKYPDVFILPFNPTQLVNIQLRIIGRYGPLPTRTQIAVRYKFEQMNTLLPVNPVGYNIIQDTLISPPPYKQYIHDFDFIALN